MTDQSSPGTQDSAARLAPAQYRCQICGRQDDSLRFVSFPYVVSLILVTYRRAFSGTWCLRHRLRSLGLAGAITASLGWLGIPFGLVFTPLTLWKLAKGGELPTAPNQAMLKALADRKQSSGDRAGAIRCLEAVLSLGEDNEAQERLSSLISYDASQFAAAPARTALRFGVALWAAFALGIAVGVIDYLFVAFLSLTVGEESPFVLVVLSWVPLIMFAVLAGLTLFHLLERRLAISRILSLLLALALASFIALLAAYGILAGRAASDLVAFALSLT